jgi:hypothetical protein
MSQPDSLHLTQCNLVLCPVVKFWLFAEIHVRPSAGRARASVVLQVDRDTGCPLSVTSDGVRKTRRRLGLPPNRSPDVSFRDRERQFKKCK